MLDPAQFILSPDQFDNKDYSNKRPLEVRSSIRDFANALHPNNPSYTKEGWEPIAQDLIPLMGKQSLTTETFLPTMFLAVKTESRRWYEGYVYIDFPSSESIAVSLTFVETFFKNLTHV